ncbi:plasmid partitioning protein RepB [Tateyamaria omphalii]|uniref:Plasmid partitioning protein RepB n=1 Tax=Tateyamaria omphalii TaxID=299262 RepID=A0A1P8N1V4_9RHOB|nr:plasmid partitioning protein RepB [Tateyamaria omphalii]APX14290.1 plasmid partitioning protein RepB [Tateyamaria omphalii]
MARKSLKDLSGIANTIARSGAKPVERSARISAPALGALQGSLAAIREIDPELIDDWGPIDRLTEFTTVNTDEDAESFDALKQSIRDGGQQVPILVRRSKTEGRYEAIYGRRRLRACRELGVKVRANIQDLDDTTALLAKGLENAARRNLSFYEKARFAEAIRAAGYDAATVRQVLNLSKSGHSHLTKVTDGVPTEVGDQIGSAPKSGRPKWTALADAFGAKRLTSASALKVLQNNLAVGSDERVELLLKEASRRGAKQGGPAQQVVPIAGVSVKASRAAVTLTAKKSGASAAFAAWLEDNLEDIIIRSHAEFEKMNTQDDS